jgi:aminoglycoside phosphotransferase (APT) family kinase protein
VQTLGWVTDTIGARSRIASIRPLQHGGWHANHAVDVVDRRGRTHRLVLREWSRPEWIVEDPDFTVEREVTILTLLAESAVPAPRVVAADPDGAVCDVPTMLITRLPGRPPRPPKDMRFFLTQLADVLLPIHSIGGRAREAVPSFRTYVELRGLTPPAWLGPTKVWEQAFNVAAGPAPATPAGFIHRDYHPGNTLWSRGRLSGIVDWTQASWGPAPIDVGWMRWNLACDHGLQAADEFLAIHQELSETAADHHPYWDVLTVVDLVAAIDREAPPPRDEGRARLEEHLAAALARL